MNFSWKFYVNGKEGKETSMKRISFHDQRKCCSYDLLIQINVAVCSGYINLKNVITVAILKYFKLLTIAFCRNQFSIKIKKYIYKSLFATAMGSPLAAVRANFAMKILSTLL